MHQINTKLPLRKFCLGTSKNNFQLVHYYHRNSVTPDTPTFGLCKNRTVRKNIYALSYVLDSFASVRRILF